MKKKKRGGRKSSTNKINPLSNFHTPGSDNPGILFSIPHSQDKIEHPVKKGFRFPYDVKSPEYDGPRERSNLRIPPSSVVDTINEGGDKAQVSSLVDAGVDGADKKEENPNPECEQP